MDPWEVAQAQVAVKYDPQQQAAQRQLDLATKNTASNEASLNQYGTQGRDIIGQSFGNLYNWLDYGKATQQQDLGQAVGASNQAYTNAISDIQGYQSKSRDYLNQMAAQLGQAGAGLRSNTELEGLVNTQLGQALAAKTNYGTSLSDWMTKMGTIADMGISSAHQNQATQTSAFEAELMKALGENKLAGTTQETDMMNKISEIMGIRQSDLISMYNELAAAEWQRQMEQAKLDEQAAEASASLQNARDIAAMQESGANSRSGSNDALGWAKLAYDKEHDATSAAYAQGQQGWQNNFDLAGQDIERQKLNPQIDRQALGNTYIEQDAFTDPKSGNFDAGRFNRWMGGDDSALMPPQPAAAPSGGGLNWKWGVGTTANSLDWLGRTVTGKHGLSFWS